MDFKESVNDNIEKIAALVGEKLGAVAGYVSNVSTQIENDGVQDTIRTAFMATVNRVDRKLKTIDDKGAEILAAVSSELKQLPGKAVQSIGKVTKEADGKLSMTVQKGTFYLIDFAGAVQSSFSKRITS